MASLNKVMLIGNLTRDPEVRHTAKGTVVASLSLAVNRSVKSEGSDRREEVTYVEVTLWGRTAELAGEYLRKGRPVFIEGRLQLESWEDKQTGQKRSRLSVVGETMQFLGGAGDKEASGGGDGGDRPSRGGQAVNAGPREPSRRARTEAPVGNGENGWDDVDDIPF